MLLYLFLLFSPFIALGSMNSIKPESTEEHVAEGRNINLTCTYEGDIYNIQWYRQYQISRPEFLLYITEGGVINPTGSDFSAYIDKKGKRVDLEISSAEVSDSAVYYCALNFYIQQSSIHKPSTLPLFNMLSLQHCVFYLMFLSILTGISCEELTPVETEENSLEGSSVTLSYRYSKQATSSDYFFWYRQYPGKPPDFILFISGMNITKKAESLTLDTRFSTKLSEEKHRVDLQISSAALSDSAVYYCALQPTVT
ncbi:uncharacterized protein LOC116065854, partial [Sander lucioperca]|uniref:uncharacterized protein LOC116065854 n=1 Tax=Sander lucioperca TaxID=283035 RepID=UPI0016537C17